MNEISFKLPRNYKYLLDCDRSYKRLCVNYIDYLPNYLKLTLGIKNRIFNKKNIDFSKFDINNIRVPLLGDRLLRIGMPYKNSFWFSMYTLLLGDKFMKLSYDEKLDTIKTNKLYNNCDIISIKDANNIMMQYMENSADKVGLVLYFIVFNYYPKKHDFNIETFGIDDYVKNILDNFDYNTSRVVFLIRFINSKYQSYYEPIIIIDRAYYNNVDSIYDVPMFKTIFNASATNIADDEMRGHLKHFLEKYEKNKNKNKNKYQNN